MVLGILACAFAIGHPGPIASTLRILYLGNSHTGTNDLTGTIKSLLESDGSGRRVTHEVIYGGFLNDMNTPETRERMQKGKWNVIVLQAALVSSSYMYVYSQAGGIELARLAVKTGAKTLLFAEWPRRGWEETEYQLDVYRKIQAAAPGSRIVGVCKAWDKVLAKNRWLELWMRDGNHSSPLGAALAAYVFYYAMAPGSGPKLRPSAIPPHLDGLFRRAAREAANDPCLPLTRSKAG